MESQNEDHGASNLLKAQSYIWNHIHNFVNSMSLKCVIDLGIPDIIHNYGKPMSLSKLISSLPIHPSKNPYIHRLMRLMTYSGFFTQQNVADNELEIEYTLTDVSRLLLKDNPMSMAPFVQGSLDPALTNPWHQLSTWLKNDDHTAFETTHGRFLWDYAAHDSKFNNIFNESMASDARLVASLLIDEKCKGVFNGLESLVDVGGGIGTLAEALSKSFPQLECIVFDLPHVVDGLQGSDNLKYVGGDMFQEIPQAHAILLKSILHDWNDEECVKILKKCKESLKKKGEEGKAIIIEMVLDNEEGNTNELVETQLFCDLAMMVLVDGKERNKKEWIKHNYNITPILGLRSIIEIYP